MNPLNSLEVRIYYEDTDCGGVVYYANYLKYFERARTHFLEEHGLSVSGLIQEGIEFRVIKADLTYRSAAIHGEILIVDTTVAANRRTAMIFSHMIREQSSQRLVVEGSATLVAVNSTGKVKRIPQPILKALKISTNSLHSST